MDTKILDKSVEKKCRLVSICKVKKINISQDWIFKRLVRLGAVSKVSISLKVYEEKHTIF